MGRNRWPDSIGISGRFVSEQVAGLGRNTHEDVELIAHRVAEVLKPLFTVKEDDKGIIFSVDELAKYLRVSAKWVYDHTYELPHFKLGGLLRFRKKAIDREIDKLLLKTHKMP